MSEWFMPTDLAPVVGEVYRAFPPTGLAGFTGPFDVDILEVVEHERMRMRWRGEQLHSEMVWELADSVPGVSLAVVQSGFLGLSGDQRRVELAETYEILFRQRLPEVLRRIAKPLPTKKPPKPKPPKSPKPSSGERWWRRLAKISTARRGGMLPFAGTMVITGLVATALAGMVLRSPSAPVGITAGASYGSKTSTTDASAASAEYRTSERFQLGYIGSITIKTGTTATNGRTAVVDLPNKATVVNA